MMPFSRLLNRISDKNRIVFSEFIKILIENININRLFLTKKNKLSF